MKPELTRAELALLGRMVVASTEPGPFPRSVADHFAREMGISYARAGVVKDIYDAGAAESASSRKEHSC